MKLITAILANLEHTPFYQPMIMLCNLSDTTSTKVIIRILVRSLYIFSSRLSSPRSSLLSLLTAKEGEGAKKGANKYALRKFNLTFFRLLQA